MNDESEVSKSAPNSSSDELIEENKRLRIALCAAGDVILTRNLPGTEHIQVMLRETFENRANRESLPQVAPTATVEKKFPTKNMHDLAEEVRDGLDQGLTDMHIKDAVFAKMEEMVIRFKASRLNITDGSASEKPTEPGVLDLIREMVKDDERARFDALVEREEWARKLRF